MKNGQKLCAALALGMTMAIASQTKASAFSPFEACNLGWIEFCGWGLDAETEVKESPPEIVTGDAAEMVSTPEPSLILGLIALGGLMLGSRKKAKA
ncbi:MAG: PEP-CTERM sorting domain-containing protein [Cyanobacteriota bacterium]|nr:PEP-CTERM sorting domain-containing protein [Cyanobacteriota bacterium]